MKQVAELQAENIQLKQEIAELKLLVSSLQAQFAQLIFSYNSKISSTTLSHGVAIKNCSLVGKLDRPSICQKGYNGATLRVSQHPDELIEYYTENRCQNCGAILTYAILHVVESKQEIVIPPVIFQVVANQNYACSCTHCHTQNKGDFLERLKAHIHYHQDVSALVAYFSVWQYLPFGCLNAMFFSVFNLNISEEALPNMPRDLTRKSRIFAYPEIQRHISHARHGHTVIEEYFSQGFPDSYYVSDCWAVQLKTTAKAHQICTAHLLRDLNGLIEVEPDNCDLNMSMKALLHRVLSLKKDIQLDDYQASNPRREPLEYGLSSLLPVDLKSVAAKMHTFLNRLIRYKRSLFNFLYHHAVPLDNNCSERTIRNVKVKSKVSGRFKSDAEAESFEVLRLVANTAHKNLQNPLQAFYTIVNAYY